jgi:DNA polymerase IIIc chi subunit
VVRSWLCDAFSFVPHLIGSQDKAVSSAAPSSASSTSAPKEQVHALAVRLADAIAHSKHGTVIVFDFVGPDRRLGALGVVLADDLTTALAATP